MKHWIGKIEIGPNHILSWALSISVFGLGLGMAERWVRPMITGPVHYEALIGLLLKIIVCLLVLGMHLRYQPRKTALLSLQISYFGFWWSCMVGWTFVNKLIFDDLLFVMGLCWFISALIGGIVVFVMLLHPNKAQGPVCAHCDYSLIGLTEPRCPECGTGFDMEEMELSPESNR